jgi:hypothetical protein
MSEASRACTWTPTINLDHAPAIGGKAGISHDEQLLRFALTLWNGRHAILKKRLFGLTNSGTNNSQDINEYYFCIRSTL